MIFTKDLIEELQKYVDMHLLMPNLEICENIMMRKSSCEVIQRDEITSYIKNNKKPSFSELLLKYIDNLGVSDSKIYKKAGIDRKHFSKIRSNPDYHPNKNTAIALALALEVDQKEVEKLIGAAGYALSNSEPFDLVITFCLQKKIYGISDINLALDHFTLKPLIGVVK